MANKANQSKEKPGKTTQSKVKKEDSKNHKVLVRYPIGQKIAKLRTDHGYNQSEICIMLSDYFDGKKIVVPTYSSWEQGIRTPGIDVIVALADFYKISIDYFFERENVYNSPTSNETNSESDQIEPNSLVKSTKPLTIAQIPEYDGRPVYITFNEYKHMGQWGIVNVKQNCVVCAGFSAQISSKIKLYPYAPEKPSRKRISTIEQLKKYNIIFVEMVAKDPLVCGQLTGYYKRDTSDQFLINQGNGNTLPFLGLNVSYYAYVG